MGQFVIDHACPPPVRCRQRGSHVARQSRGRGGANNRLAIRAPPHQQETVPRRVGRKTERPKTTRGGCWPFGRHSSNVLLANLGDYGPGPAASTRRAGGSQLAPEPRLIPHSFPTTSVVAAQLRKQHHRFQHGLSGRTKIRRSRADRRDTTTQVSRSEPRSAREVGDRQAYRGERPRPQETVLILHTPGTVLDRKMRMPCGLPLRW